MTRSPWVRLHPRRQRDRDIGVVDRTVMEVLIVVVVVVDYQQDERVDVGRERPHPDIGVRLDRQIDRVARDQQRLDRLDLVAEQADLLPEGLCVRIVLVGEVRDFETAQITIQTALTGHLVFSTIHTNTAAGGATRLIDMGIDPFLINSSVEAFIAQRLVRVICPDCKAEITNEKLDIGEKIPGVDGGRPFYRGKGCKSCNETGYKGRAGIYEILVISYYIPYYIFYYQAFCILFR